MKIKGKLNNIQKEDEGMTTPTQRIREILEELVYKVTKQPRAFIPNCDKKISHSLTQIKQLIEGMMPEEKEVGEIRYGGCNPDEDRGWNACIADLKLRLEKL